MREAVGADLKKDLAVQPLLWLQGRLQRSLAGHTMVKYSDFSRSGMETDQTLALLLWDFRCGTSKANVCSGSLCPDHSFSEILHLERVKPYEVMGVSDGCFGVSLFNLTRSF